MPSLAFPHSCSSILFMCFPLIGFVAAQPLKSRAATDRSDPNARTGHMPLLPIIFFILPALVVRERSQERKSKTPNRICPRSDRPRAPRVRLRSIQSQRILAYGANKGAPAGGRTGDAGIEPRPGPLSEKRLQKSRCDQLLHQSFKINPAAFAKPSPHAEALLS